MTETNELTNDTDKVVTIDIVLTPEEINPSDFDWPIDEAIGHEYAEFLAFNLKCELNKFEFDSNVRVTYVHEPDGSEIDYPMFSDNISNLVSVSIHHAMNASYLFLNACPNRAEWRQAFDHHNQPTWQRILDDYMSGALSSSDTGSAGPSGRAVEGRSFNSTRLKELASRTQDKASNHNSPITVDIRLTPNNLHPAGFGEPVNVSMGHEFANFLKTNIVYEMQRRAIPSSVHVTYNPNPDGDEGDHQAFSINTSDEVIELIRHVWIASWQWWQSCQTLEDWRQIYREQSLANWSDFFDGYWNTQYPCSKAKPPLDLDDLVTIDIHLTPEDMDDDELFGIIGPSFGHKYAKFLSANLRHQLQRFGNPCGVHVVYRPNPDGSEHDHPTLSGNISDKAKHVIHNVEIASWDWLQMVANRSDWQALLDTPNPTEWRSFIDGYLNSDGYYLDSEGELNPIPEIENRVDFTFWFSRTYVTPECRLICRSDDFVDDFGAQLANVMDAVIRDFCTRNAIAATLDIQFVPDLSASSYDQLSGPLKTTETLVPQLNRLIDDIWHGFKTCQNLNDWRQFHDYHVYGANRHHPAT